jgi:aryl-alcohol dehydrogenase-like predicted oxidoreductase
MGMTRSYGPAAEAQSIATLHRAIELGCTFFDTAGNSGPFLKRSCSVGRSKAGVTKQVIAAKLGFRFDGNRIVGVDSRPEHIREAMAGRLRRIGTD